MSQKLHPLHDADWVLLYIASTGEYPGRHKTGTSTAQALRYIAKAIDTPERPVELLDHAGGAATAVLADTIAQMVQALKLRHLHVACRGNRCGWFIVFSKTCPPRSKS